MGIYILENEPEQFFKMGTDVKSLFKSLARFD